MTKQDDAFVVPFKQRLRQAIQLRRISQQDLAVEIGVSKSTISNYINGLRYPNRDGIAKLAEVLEVSPGWLMGIRGINIDDTLDMLKEKEVLKKEKIELIGKNLSKLELDEISLLIRVMEALFLGKVNFDNDS